MPCRDCRSRRPVAVLSTEHGVVLYCRNASASLCQPRCNETAVTDVSQCGIIESQLSSSSCRCRTEVGLIASMNVLSVYLISSAACETGFSQINLQQAQLHHHHHHPHPHHRTTGLTWCRHSSASGRRYKVNVTHVVSVRKSGKTDTSSTQYGMMRRLALT